MKEIKNSGLLLLFLSMIVMGACNKTDDEGPNIKDQEHDQIQKYADENQLNGQFTDSGLYYMVEIQGSDKHPAFNSIITVTYKGYYLDGTILDEGSFYSERLNLLIAGWKEGIPHIGEGGKITLIIPSHLAYNNGVLVFEVTLHNIAK